MQTQLIVRSTRLLGFAFLLLSFLPTSPIRASEASLFTNTQPTFNPLAFYTGHTRSWGVFEDRNARPTEIITTETWGRVIHGELRMEQTLHLGNQSAQHRSWRMRQIDAHHFEATANDIIGIARGQSTGNYFTWSFTLALKPGNPLYNIHMTQNMYLQPDGKTMVNRDTIKKFGILLAQVTEQFRHL